jgi:DNA replication licensing factor MCM2
MILNKQSLFLNLLENKLEYNKNFPNFSNLKKQKFFFFTNLKQWLKLLINRDLIKHRFFCFLLETFNENFGSNFYCEKIYQSFFFNKKLFLISFLHLVVMDPLMAIWIIDEPHEMISIFKEAILEILYDLSKKEDSIKTDVLIKILELPICDSLKNLKNFKINTLLKIKGIVISKTNIYPFLKIFKLTCLKCFESQKTIYSIKNIKKMIITSCFNCKAVGPFQINWAAFEQNNFQKIFIQETSKFIYSENFPFFKEIILKNDLIDSIKLGEEIEITGVLKYNFEINRINFLNPRHFSTNIEANNIEKTKQIFDISFDKNEELILNNIFKKKNILEHLLDSFMPSILIQNDYKLSLLICFFGGETKKLDLNFNSRKNINLIIIGDPGTGKSQILNTVEKNLTKSIIISGKKISTKEFTASLKFQKSNNEWVIEGGALVFCDKGVCLIDEIEKLNSLNFVFLKDAMEKQFISLEKKEFRDLLKTRCSFITTTNPINEYYDSNYSIIKNSHLEENILSNFDIHLIIQDKIDILTDDEYGNFVIKSHIKNHSTKFFEKKKKLSQHLFRKYIFYSKYTIKSIKNKINHEKLTKLYSLLRKEDFSSGGIKLALKHLETMLRLIEASARMHLRENTSKKDMTIGIAVFLTSFFNIQPNKIKNFLKLRYKKFLKPIENINEYCLGILLSFFIKNSKFKKNLKLSQQKFEKKLEDIQIRKKIIRKFYMSSYFIDHGFRLEKYKKIIFYF